MLVTSRMWQFTRWMPVAWWRPRPAEAPAGEQRPGRPIPLQATFPRRRLRSVRTFSSRPTQRWPCLIRSGRAAEGAVPAAVEAVVVAGGGGPAGEGGSGGGGAGGGGKGGATAGGRGGAGGENGHD